MKARKKKRSKAAKKGWTTRKEKRAPLSKLQRQFVSEKIAYLIREEGKAPKQAAAIAYSIARRDVPR